MLVRRGEGRGGGMREESCMGKVEGRGGDGRRCGRGRGVQEERGDESSRRTE